MGLPVVRGRSLSRNDTSASPWVVVIDEELASAYWPDEDPLGRSLSFAQFGDPRPRQIVGIVASVRHEALRNRPRGTIYLPFTQQPAETSRPHARLHMSFVVRTSEDSERLAPLIVSAVGRVDKDVPVFAVAPMETYLTGSARETRFQTVLMVAFACVAALLSVVGIYGVARYSVSQRTHEFGVRVALGAAPSQITRLVLGQAWRLGAAGLVVGVGLAVGLTRFLKTMLFGVEATDRPTFAVVAVVLGMVVLAASYLPARRASRVDPVEALRHE